MLKYSGCMLIAVCSLIWGFEKSSSLMKSVKVLDAVGNMIKSIGEQIETMCTPLPDIYESYRDSVLENIGFISALNASGFSAAIESIKESVPEEAYSVLCAYAKKLGGSSRESEAEMSKGTYVKLNAISVKIKESLPERTRMYKILPLLFSLTAIILII